MREAEGEAGRTRFHGLVFSCTPIAVMFPKYNI